MSRKPRSQPKLELVRTATDLVEPQPIAGVRLTDDLADTLEAIVSGCILLADAPMPAMARADLQDEEAFSEVLPGEMPEEPDDDLEEVPESLREGMDALVPIAHEDVTELGTLDALYGSIGFTIRILARALIARAIGVEPQLPRDTENVPGSAEADAESRALDSLAQALLPPGLPRDLRLSREDRREAMAHAVSLVREIALEEFDLACEVEVGRDGVVELFAEPISPAASHVSLLELLFDRAEAAVFSRHAYLPLERDASRWEFMRWSGSPPPGLVPPDIADFARGVRELEYSLADRMTVALGDPVIDLFAGDPAFAELCPRQHVMAVALTGSFTDVFECVSVDGTRVGVQSVRTGRRYDIDDHADLVVYAPGWLLAGRLLPLEDGRHFRSPGMVFLPPSDSHLVGRAIEGIERTFDHLPPALALEAVISSVFFGVKVPRDDKPMHSRRDARALLEVLEEVAEGFDPTGTLSEFTAAVRAQANAGSGTDGTSGGQHARRHRKRGRRR